MDFHLKAHVDCTDGRIGRLENIIVNPQAERITYLVIKEHDIANTLRLVPERFVKSADRDTVVLRIDKEKFQKMKHFIQEDYIPSNIMLYMAEQEAHCPRRFVSGPWQYGNMKGYTSRGTGSSGLPVRYSCPPEITLHKLI